MPSARTATLFALLPLLGQTVAQNQPPYTVLTRTVNSAVSAKIEADISAYVTGVEGSPAWSTAAAALASGNPDLADAVGSDPVVLAFDYLTATATPTWFADVDAAVQSFVVSVANAEATIAAKDSGAVSFKAGRRDGWLMSAAGVFACAAAGIILL